MTRFLVIGVGRRELGRAGTGTSQYARVARAVLSKPSTRLEACCLDRITLWIKLSLARIGESLQNIRSRGRESFFARSIDC